ncbi:uncharacterized protein VTP21DRAFT_10453 [Calcarisporiella thermophila]|uniref:uncharacterized protein n=1 Tax=Calcarisporiella thermophila TaxID=911321 RepID=UPI0037427BF0
MTRKNFDLNSIVRPNILVLKPYRCARDDYTSGILLDANENAFGPAATIDPAGYGDHRYPDPYQVDIKEKLVSLRNLRTIKQIFVGVGSDEVIDLVMRIFCIPGKDKILITPPTYGMYSVQAQINDVEVVKVMLDVEEGKFQLRLNDIDEAIRNNPDIKIIFLCSPGNPTGTSLTHESIRAVLENPHYRGIVVVDEAYVDFVTDETRGSVASWVHEYPNLLVMQTLSKSFGLAGIRLGVAIANPDIIQIMNNTKAPYNIGNPSSRIANEALSPTGIQTMLSNRALIHEQRDRLLRELGDPNKRPEGIGRILGANDANFLLVQILDKSGRPSNKRAEGIYRSLAETRGVVVRFRGNDPGCEACLRITVGTVEENDILLNELRKALANIE